MIRRLLLATTLALGAGAAVPADVQYGIEVEPADLLYMMGQHAAGAILEAQALARQVQGQLP